jgi:hypothetical protein
MSRYHDPRQKEFSVRWQSWLSAGSGLYGAARAFQAHRYISELRVMRRRLLAGRKARLLDFRPLPQTKDYQFLLNRNHKMIRKAFDRGEATHVMRRRGLLDPLGRHSFFQRRPKRG